MNPAPHTEIENENNNIKDPYIVSLCALAQSLPERGQLPPHQRQGAARNGTSKDN